MHIHNASNCYGKGHEAPAFSAPGLGGDQHTGMLVVDTVLPGGPADGRLQPGDVLVRLSCERTQMRLSFAQVLVIPIMTLCKRAGA